MAVCDAQHFLHLLTPRAAKHAPCPKKGVVLCNAFCNFDRVATRGNYIFYEFVIKSGRF